MTTAKNTVFIGLELEYCHQQKKPCIYICKLCNLLRQVFSILESFSTKTSHLCQKAKFLNFMVMQTRKPENESNLFRE